ncbi:MAG: hypothetical protein JXR94_17995 [Candidatus Hydrogenedentes bacterium]|nr:hypothetical protein [Candidatus Hydrogenedentota bacterium]
MYWNLTIEPADAEAGELPADGRFVLHRHCDEAGPHLDLRLEQDGWLTGWRIDAASLDGAPWAAEKAPHPIRWLDEDGDAVREDAGVFTWLERGRDARRVLLQGHDGARTVRAIREEGLRPEVARSLREALAACGADAEAAAGLIADGATARQRVVERLCGLARELDGEAFDEGVTRKAMAPLSLEEIQRHLRAYEVRFDHKYPPQPVSRPEPLEVDETGLRGEEALAILRG